MPVSNTFKPFATRKVLPERRTVVVQRVARRGGPRHVTAGVLKLWLPGQEGRFPT